jgi:hypothetical protein
VEIVAGEEQVVEAALRAESTLTPHLRRGDAVAIDDRSATAEAATVAPGRRKITLFRDGAAIESRWIDVPAGTCWLVDMPELRCETP